MTEVSGERGSLGYRRCEGKQPVLNLEGGKQESVKLPCSEKDDEKLEKMQKSSVLALRLEQKP